VANVSFLRFVDYGSGSAGATVAVASGGTAPTAISIPSAIANLDAYRVAVSLAAGVTQTVYLLPSSGDNRTSAYAITGGQTIEVGPFRRTELPRLFASGACNAQVTLLGVGNEV
jgi:hypothetical protein